jgi:hypothetical protein
MTYQEAIEKAKARDKTLRSDKDFNHVVTLNHMDDSRLEFHGADMVEWAGAVHGVSWIVVFTEHHGYFVYHQVDLAGRSQVPMEEFYQDQE